MNTATIRQRLHNYLEVADDRKIKAMFTMVEESIQETEVAYTEDVKTELDRRSKSYRKARRSGISQQESQARIGGILKSAKK